MRHGHSASLLATLAGAWALGVGVACAAGAADGPVLTASEHADIPTATTAGGSGDETARQISAWIHSDPDGGADSGDSSAPAQVRKVHGEVSAGIGSNGYRTVSGVADMPVGRTGDLVVAASDASFDGRRGWGGGSARSFAVGLYLGGASPRPACAAPPPDGYGRDEGYGPPPGYGSDGNDGPPPCQRGAP